MKKILFLLLCSVSIYAQNPTGQEQEFDYGIKNNAAQIVSSADTLVTNGVDGTYGKISANDLLKEKAFLPTGLLKNGALSINAVNTTYDLSAGTGIITNFDNPDAPTSRVVTFPEVIGKTPTYLTTAIITYVGIQEIGTTGVGQIIEQASPFTVDQNHDLIPIGAVIHSNLTNINIINNITNPSNDIGGQFHAFLDKLGAFNVTGNKFVANGANLGLNKSAGSLYKRGSNFINNWKNANEIAQTATTYLTFRYRTQIDNEGADRVNLDPSLYDLGGVLTAVPSNKFTIQTVNVFQEGAVRVQWGQTIYNSLAEAEAALPTRAFVKESNIALQAVPRAYIILKNTATSLLVAADAKIIEAGRFDGFVSGGAALTLDAIISALGYTPENVANKQNSLAVDGTGAKYPTVDAVNASVVKLTGDQSIDGVKTFVKDALINTLTVGKGGGDIATNTAVGYQSLLVNTTGNGNVTNGYRTLYRNTIGKFNIAVGFESLFNNTLGINNVSSGFRSLYANTEGSNNVANGYQSLFSNTTGVSNIAEGYQSLYLNTTGVNNTAIGASALYANTTGGANTASGFQSGRYIGDKSTVATILNNSLMLGYRTSPLADNQSNQTVIGYDATGLGSNSTVIGNSSTIKARVWGKLLSGTSDDDGVNQIQVPNGNISSLPAVNANQVVVKSQLDLKADLTYVDTATIPSGTITTAASITNATLTDLGYTQNKKTLLISNGASNINYTVNGGLTASFVKGGTGTITFVQGAGRTLVGANGTLVFNGLQYSTASIVSFGTTDIIYINNF